MWMSACSRTSPSRSESPYSCAPRCLTSSTASTSPAVPDLWAPTATSATPSATSMALPVSVPASPLTCSWSGRSFSSFETPPKPSVRLKWGATPTKLGRKGLMCSHFLRLTAILVMISPFSYAAQSSSGSQPASASPQASKPTVKKVAPSYTDPSSGKEMYMAYCASCHGADGKGNGPAAAALKTQPTDLTQIAAKNGGTFPDAHIAQIIKGDSSTAAHGSKEMPVWGPMFLEIGHDTAQVQLRIRNLTKYLASIQQK